MHAWIGSRLLDELDNQFVVGQMYEIHNFKVVPFTEKYKCFDADKQIILTQMTEVRVLSQYNALFPLNIYHFTNLSQLQAIDTGDKHLIGMFIGFIFLKKVPRVYYENKLTYTQILYTH